MMKNVLYFLKSWRNLSLMISQLSILMKVVLNLMRTGLTVILIVTYAVKSVDLEPIPNSV